MEFGGRIGMNKEVSVLGDGSGGAPDGRGWSQLCTLEEMERVVCT